MRRRTVPLVLTLSARARGARCPLQLSCGTGVYHRLGAWAEGGDDADGDEEDGAEGLAVHNAAWCAARL